MTIRRVLAAVVGAAALVAPANAIAAVDLSTYTRVGRYDLPEPTRTTPPAGSLLAKEVSAVTYNPDTDTLFVVGDESTSVVQVSKTGQLIDSMTLAAGAFDDVEGLTYAGNGQFVLAEERQRRLVRFTYAANTTLTAAQTQSVKLGTTIGNEGFEGLSRDPVTAGFVVVKELNPIGVFQTTVDWTAGTATVGNPDAVNVPNLFDTAALGVSDLADVFALQDGSLLLLSQENGKLLSVTRAGAVTSSLTVGTADEGHEGVAMDGAGRIYVTNENGGGDVEHPQLWVYAPATGPNAAPTGVALTNPVTSVASTATRVKVADITVSDDGQGTNTLAVTGADAPAFEIDGTSLYLKAGAPLDRASFSVAVTVDDMTVGATPDATSTTLTIAVSTLAVTEASPWSSGNSPYRADWFEVTNRGTGAVDITAWKVDDSSNAFATALALNGVTSIAAGESVLFVEGTAATAEALRAAWALGPEVKIGFYSGSGIGLSTDGDAVNLFNASGTRITGVSFGASTSGFTFENVSGVKLSVAGVNGAYTLNGETGSPGRIAAPLTEVKTPGQIVGTVPPQLALTLGLPATFAPFVAGVAREYSATTTATVTSTAGDAALTVVDAGTTAPGRLVNGSFALAQPLEVNADGGAYAPVSGTPAALITYTAPVSRDEVAIGVKQPIGGTEPLRSGSYTKTVTFTLSTTNP